MRTIIVVLAMLRSIISFGQWEVISLPDESSLLADMSFVNENTGFFLVNDTTFEGFSFQRIFMTSDYGTTWSPVFENFVGDMLGGSGYRILDIDFLTPEIGFLVAQRFPMWHREIMKSNDGGVSWEIVSAQGFPLFAVIEFENEMVGFGSSDASQQSVRSSTVDGGVTWTEFSPQGGYTLDLFAPGSCSLIGGMTAYSTVDYGQSWQQTVMQLPPGTHLRSSSFEASKHHYAGYGMSPEGLFNVGNYVRTNPYDNMAELYIFPNSQLLRDILFLSDTEGYIVGSANELPGALLKTWDGGDTWHQQEYPDLGWPYGPTFREIECPSSQVCYLNGVEHLYRTLNGGGPSIGLADYTVSTVQLAKPKTTLEVFPNPATDMVNVTFSLPLHGTGRLSIIDHTGRQVLSQTISAGITTAEVDVRALAAGVCLLRIEAPPTPQGGETVDVQTIKLMIE